jgi:hypothetical protein
MELRHLTTRESVKVGEEAVEILCGSEVEMDGVAESDDSDSSKPHYGDHQKEEALLVR